MDKNIYNTVEGNNLLNFDNFPLEVINYLYMERNLVSEIISNYDIIVEVGCFDATYLSLACKNNKKYIGIDISGKNIEEAKRRAEFKSIPGEMYELFEFNAERLIDIYEHSVLYSNKELKKIILFPFNVIGNIQNINELVSYISNVSSDILISSFFTNDYATYWRKKYYESCCTSIDIRYETDGVRFVSVDGLNSIAYNLNWFMNQFSSSEKENNFFYFGKIGMSLLSRAAKGQ